MSNYERFIYLFYNGFLKSLLVVPRRWRASFVGVFGFGAIGGVIDLDWGLPVLFGS